MPYYDYEHEGVVIEREYPIGQAPETITVEGVTFKQAINRNVTSIVRGNPHFASKALPRYWKYHKGKFNKRGECLIESGRTIRESVAFARDCGEDVQYDDEMGRTAR